MKILFTMIILSLSYITYGQQTITITNYSPCDVRFLLGANDNSGCQHNVFSIYYTLTGGDQLVFDNSSNQPTWTSTPSGTPVFVSCYAEELNIINCGARVYESNEVCSCCGIPSGSSPTSCQCDATTVYLTWSSSSYGGNVTVDIN